MGGGRRRIRSGKLHSDHKETQRLIKQRCLINECLERDPVDIATLKRIATEEKGGFLNSQLRKKVWPHLLRVNEKKEPRNTKEPNADHAYKHQIQLDIDRSLWHFDCLKRIKESERRKKRKQLFSLIDDIICRNEDLHYYQGYHDVCSVFLLVQGESQTLETIEQASLLFHREPMRSNFSNVMELNKQIFSIIKFKNEQLYHFIQKSGVEPYFALPWIITWFAHHLENFDAVARLYDVFLSSHPYFSLYMSASLVIHHKKTIMDCPCDFGAVHYALSKLIKKMDVEREIYNARLLYSEFPPRNLQNITKDKVDESYLRVITTRIVSSFNNTFLTQNRSKANQKATIAISSRSKESMPKTARSNGKVYYFYASALGCFFAVLVGLIIRQMN